MTVYLAFSFDTEQPQLLDYLPEYIIKKEEYLKLDKESKKLIWADYIREGIWRDSDLFKRSQSELETILELNELFSEFNGKFTSFVLGRWLDLIVNEFGQEEVRKYFKGSAIDVQSHSYNHKAYKTTGDKTREDISPTLNKSEVYQEIKKSKDSINKNLNLKPVGLRVPMGNIEPLGKDDLEILNALRDNGMSYISSWLKSEQKKPNSVGKVEPFFYKDLGYPDIIEIPSVGYFDLHYTQPARMLVFDEEDNVWNINQRTSYYTNLLEEALNIKDKDIFVTLVCHPWAVKYYDSRLEFHRNVLSFSKKEKINIISYTEINDLMRK